MPHLSLRLSDLERFRANLERLVGATPAKLGIAVSGGPDSLALLLLACAAFPAGVEAATVDHGLRAESAGEADLVAVICDRIGCPHSILPVRVEPGGEGIQGEARRARYAALEDWADRCGIGLVATAHHADDQAETILMRLQRGSGLSGLAGIRSARPLGSALLIRPLLDWTRDELSEIVRAARVEAADDPSNRDVRFDRVAMRNFLAENPQFDPRRLARSASSLAEANEALDWAAGQLFDDRVRRDGEALILDPAALPPELARRLLLRLLAETVPQSTSPRGEEVQRLARKLQSGATLTLAGVKCIGGTFWRFETEAPRRAKRP
ncbi:MAG: tRNA lysidine(34) synthetase TilS [Sphingosinicella sp.]|nr:tRNA lysidine(34) synthetase TilS [Sphingosinicella sp.]